MPDRPGLGVEPNPEVVKAHLKEPGYFEPTPEWDNERSWDRLWSSVPSRGGLARHPEAVPGRRTRDLRLPFLLDSGESPGGKP